MWGLCKIYAHLVQKQTKLMWIFGRIKSYILNDNISLYQPDDMLLEAVLVIMESKHLMY